MRSIRFEGACWSDTKIFARSGPISIGRRGQSPVSVALSVSGAYPSGGADPGFRFAPPSAFHLTLLCGSSDRGGDYLPALATLATIALLAKIKTTSTTANWNSTVPTLKTFSGSNGLNQPEGSSRHDW